MPTKVEFKRVLNSPTNTSTDYLDIYAKVDNKFYVRDEDGNETSLQGDKGDNAIIPGVVSLDYFNRQLFSDLHDEVDGSRGSEEYKQHHMVISDGVNLFFPYTPATDSERLRKMHAGIEQANGTGGYLIFVENEDHETIESDRYFFKVVSVVSENATYPNARRVQLKFFPKGSQTNPFVSDPDSIELAYTSWTIWLSAPLPTTNGVFEAQSKLPATFKVTTTSGWPSSAIDETEDLVHIAKDSTDATKTIITLLPVGDRVDFINNINDTNGLLYVFRGTLTAYYKIDSLAIGTTIVAKLSQLRIGIEADLLNAFAGFFPTTVVTYGTNIGNVSSSNFTLGSGISEVEGADVFVKYPGAGYRPLNDWWLLSASDYAQTNEYSFDSLHLFTNRAGLARFTHDSSTGVSTLLLSRDSRFENNARHHQEFFVKNIKKGSILKLNLRDAKDGYTQVDHIAYFQVTKTAKIDSSANPVYTIELAFIKRSTTDAIHADFYAPPSQNFLFVYQSERDSHEIRDALAGLSGSDRLSVDSLKDTGEIIDTIATDPDVAGDLVKVGTGHINYHTANGLTYNFVDFDLDENGHGMLLNQGENRLYDLDITTGRATVLEPSVSEFGNSITEAYGVCYSPYTHKWYLIGRQSTNFELFEITLDTNVAGRFPSPVTNMGLTFSATLVPRNLVAMGSLLYGLINIDSAGWRLYKFSLTNGAATAIGSGVNLGLADYMPTTEVSPALGLWGGEVVVINEYSHSKVNGGVFLISLTTGKVTKRLRSSEDFAAGIKEITGAATYNRETYATSNNSTPAKRSLYKNEGHLGSVHFRNGLSFYDKLSNPYGYVDPVDNKAVGNTFTYIRDTSNRKQGRYYYDGSDYKKLIDETDQYAYPPLTTSFGNFLYVANQASVKGSASVSDKAFTVSTSSSDIQSGYDFAIIMPYSTSKNFLLNLFDNVRRIQDTRNFLCAIISSEVYYVEISSTVNTTVVLSVTERIILSCKIVKRNSERNPFRHLSPLTSVAFYSSLANSSNVPSNVRSTDFVASSEWTVGDLIRFTRFVNLGSPSELYVKANPNARISYINEGDIYQYTSHNDWERISRGESLWQQVFVSSASTTGASYYRGFDVLSSATAWSQFLGSIDELRLGIRFQYPDSVGAGRWGFVHINPIDIGSWNKFSIVGSTQNFNSGPHGSYAINLLGGSDNQANIVTVTVLLARRPQGIALKIIAPVTNAEAYIVVLYAR